MSECLRADLLQQKREAKIIDDERTETIPSYPPEYQHFIQLPKNALDF